jgi:hypothetical protein
MALQNDLKNLIPGGSSGLAGTKTVSLKTDTPIVKLPTTPTTNTGARPTMDDRDYMSGLQIPTVGKPTTLQDELNKLSADKNADTGGNLFGTGGSSFKTDGQSWQVHNPDYGALDASFQEILKSFDMYRSSLQDQSETGKLELQQQLEYLLGQIGDSRKDNKQALSSARGTLSEDAFSRQRALQSQMSARGLGGSGIEQLGQVQDRMATGKAVAEIAGAYYDTEEQLMQQIEQSQQNYNMATRKLNDSLNSALAQIMSQEASAKMDYTQTVDNLKRQVIADSNQALQAQREYEASVQSLKMQQQSLNLQMQQYKDAKAEANKPISEWELMSVIENPQMSEASKKAFMNDLGLSPERQTQLINDWKSGETQAKQTVLQSRIDNMRKANIPQKEITALVKQWASSGEDISGLDWDGTKKTVGTTNPGGTSTVTPPSDKNYTTPGGHTTLYRGMPLKTELTNAGWTGGNSNRQ